MGRRHWPTPLVMVARQFNSTVDSRLRSRDGAIASPRSQTSRQQGADGDCQNAEEPARISPGCGETWPPVENRTPPISYKLSWMGKAGRERCALGGPRTATAFRPAKSVGSPPYFASLFKVRKMSRMLTAREREVMLLAAEGLSDKEIARRLKISDNTVSVHLQHIYRKFKICNRTMLAALAASS